MSEGSQYLRYLRQVPMLAKLGKLCNVEVMPPKKVPPYRDNYLHAHVKPTTTRADLGRPLSPSRAALLSVLLWDHRDVALSHMRLVV